MLRVFKIGGNVVDNPEKLDKFLTDFAALEGDRILVHGGGKIATQISKALGIETKMIDGRRVTDEDTLRVVTMVYAGFVNKTIVNKLNYLGRPTVGLSGADGRLIVSRRRSPEPVDYGFVGDPESVNTGLIDALSGKGYTIVVAPITADGESLLNTNADTVAQAVAVGMAQAGGKEVELIYCFEKNGVLLDADDDSSVIPEIDTERFEELKSSGAVHSGMIPKLQNAFAAIDKGVCRVVICNADNISTPGYGGTTVVK